MFINWSHIQKFRVSRQSYLGFQYSHLQHCWTLNSN
jgi:hypothetical protein